MSSEEAHANDLAAARKAVEEGRQQVKELTENIGEAMAVNDNKQAGKILRERQKAQRELDRLEEALRALEEGQSHEA
ncbi:hypothetical protein [Nitrococcus mobilis]|uniref:Uncharacterized protein n=1 Tax=Nitrococcus mobilis Nb-231 TaxID=314278 RepID=A4BM63_9GAMM|nr:hypothetical protein [Nitrococcus mobilis]EAR23401.1 hypothetical protein NB231_16313 [Nitrococcus mobilis Nb-231]